MRYVVHDKHETVKFIWNSIKIKVGVRVLYILYGTGKLRGSGVAVTANNLICAGVSRIKV